MDRPSTPDNNSGGGHGYQPLTGAPPAANGPPSYFEVPNDNTPTGTPGNGSGMRLLTSVDSGMERPYVAPNPMRQEPAPAFASDRGNSAARMMQGQMLPRRKTVNVRIVDTPTVLGSRETDSGRTTTVNGDSGDGKTEIPGRHTNPPVLELPSLPPLAAKSSASSVSPTKRTSTRGLREVIECGSGDDTVVGGVDSGNQTEQLGRIPPLKSSNLQSVYRSTPGRAQRSSTPSVLNNAPRIPPPGEAPVYAEYSPGRGSPVQWSPSRAGSIASKRPPSRMQYERADINGSPRPGTPSSQYGGSPRRPLPPAPLFSKVPSSVSEVHDEKNGIEETSIPISPSEDNDDPFVGGETRSELRSRNSYHSDETYDEEEEDDEEYDEKMSHYGPAPKTRHARRGARQPQMSRKEVALINGELILECKIPTILQSFLPRKDGSEFTHMRYTAVTCEPDDFSLNGYKLRQQIMSPTRETELFICITMYNETEIDFTRTMHGVMRNISHFCSRSKSRTWGKNGWQKIVVCIVSDGRAKVHPRTLDALAAMGVYQDGIAKNMVNQKEVKAHVYEYTTQVSMDSDLKFKGAEKGIVPCQMIFCLKEKNAKKLNSHRWFFNAFGKALQPNVCILLDVGTRPGPNALYHLWKAFDNDSNVAGACGEIIAGKGKHWLGLLNPLVASQNFEYKMSNILDKPIESVFGYITVLPGALSAYRYYALQNDSTGQGPLSQYFKGEALHGSNADVFTANMYLAEDRILCWELVAKRDERWVLKYVRRATGETDVPDSVPEFVSQRRRWLNGAFFAAVYSMVHCRQIWRTDHTIARKVLLHIEFVYQFIQLCFTWFSLANFYLTFYFIAGGLSDPRMDPFGHNIGLYIFVFLRYCCVLLICTQFILSMGNRPQGAKRMFFTSMVVYAVIMAYTTFATLYIVIKDFTGNSKGLMTDSLFINIVVSTASTVGLYFLMSFIYLDPWHMFTSAAQYFALLPSYICTLQIYAFCNTHDISWGTKGDNVTKTDLGAAVGSKEGAVTLEMPSEQLDIDSGYDEALRNLRDRIEVPEVGTSESQMQEDYYRAVRTYMVLAWLISNAILAMAVSEAYDIKNISSNFYLTLILWSVAVLALFRAVGSTCYRLIGIVHSISNAKAKIKSGNLKAPDWISEGSSKVSSKFGGGSKIGSSSGTSRFSFFSRSSGSGISSKFSNLTSRE